MPYPTEKSWIQLLTNITDEIDAVVSTSGKHSKRVARWGKKVGQQLGLKGRELDTIYWGAMFHDVGKIGIPKEILKKDGPLTKTEWNMIELHPTIGANIVMATKSFYTIIPIIETHQERFDGKGYPGGIYGKSIPIGARILNVVDAYDAMTDDRPYRLACSPSEAMDEIIHLQGRQFDPKVVDCFTEILTQEGCLN